MRTVDEMQTPLQLRIPNMFNPSYEKKLNEGEEWETLEKISVKCTREDEARLEQSTQHLLQCVHRDPEGDRPVASHTRHGCAVDPKTRESKVPKEEVSPKRKATVAARLEQAARRCAEPTPAASLSDGKPIYEASAGEELPADPRPRVARGITTERLSLQARARAQHQQDEQKLVQQLNAMADANMKARGLNPVSEKPVSTGSESGSIETPDEAKPWPKSIPT